MRLWKKDGARLCVAAARALGHAHTRARAHAHDCDARRRADAYQMYNGLHAKVMEFDLKTKRYRLKLDASGTAFDEKVLSVRRRNLKLC